MKRCVHVKKKVPKSSNHFLLLPFEILITERRKEKEKAKKKEARTFFPTLLEPNKSLVFLYFLEPPFTYLLSVFSHR
jgi:hypothetical protein